MAAGPGGITARLCWWLPRIVDNEAGAGAHAAPTHRLWGAVLALILVVAFINIGARVIAGIYAPGKS
jgi:hypothetical protein